MGRKMYRGKQQIMFNNLPGRTFDFERVATIARVTTIRGIQRTDLNVAIVLRRIAEEARAWHSQYRPIFRDDVLQNPARFVLIDPQSVQAEMFPKVFWCQNQACGRVFDYSGRDSLPPRKCSTCNQGELVQLRFIKIHRCGSLQPLRPPTCSKCHSSDYMALETRGSERISNFRWMCRRCGNHLSVYGGRCSECQWPDSDQNSRRMDIEVHRAGRTYYAHTVVLLNIPHRELDSFFALPEWPAIVAAKFLNLPEVSQRQLSDFTSTEFVGSDISDNGITGSDLDSLLSRQASGEITAEQFVAEMDSLRRRRQQERQSISPSNIANSLAQSTGVPNSVWEDVGQELLDAVIPLENSQPQDLLSEIPLSLPAQSAQRMGFSRLALVNDFPIITATYGYSRAEYVPNQCRLNPFPPDREHGGRFPIFVDQIQADALLITLKANRVCTWLERNGFTPQIPAGTNFTLSQQAYFARLFHGVPTRETLLNDRPEARMVFGLLHTLSHLCIRQATLLCGLDRSSLSEYLLPPALTFALYSNHRFGATIGALTALFEQSVEEWLNAIRDNQHCIYDPVCYERESSCHACTHLPETSCRYFNLNLSRSLLFGGPDPQLGHIHFGYFDLSLQE